MPDEKVQALLNEAAKDLRILDVFLRSSTTRVAESFIPTNEKELGFQFRFHTTRERGCVVSASEFDPSEQNAEQKITVVEYMVTADARFLHPDYADDSAPTDKLAEGALFAEVHAIFSAVYLRNACSQEALREFGLRNVPYHVWPYWREFLQSMMPRMRLPPVTLGMYSAGQRAHAPATMDGLLSESRNMKDASKKKKKSLKNEHAE